MAVALFAIGILASLVSHQEVVAGNVYAFGVALGGLSRGEAEAAIEQGVRAVENGPLTFVAGARSIQVGGDELRVLLDEDDLLNDLRSYVAERPRLLPSFLLRLGARRVMAAPADIVSPDADRVLQKIASALSSPALGTRYGFEGRELKVMPPQPGQRVTPQDVRRALQAVEGTAIQVAYEEISAPPASNLEPLPLIAEFSTPYDPKETDRNVNLSLAALAVHGKVLPPGATYSFNKEAGERTEAKGYRYANVVVGDHLEPGLAGGICQVTTTLFNAAAMAGLDFPEVHAHGIPVEYVPPGRDAAVAWDYLDIKIANRGPSAVVFGCWVENGQVTVRVYGKGNGHTYELLPVVVKEYPEPGKEPGLLVETYRVEKSGSTEVARTLLLRSVYLAHVPVPPKR